MSTAKQASQKPKEHPTKQSALTIHYGQLLAKCISINSAVESSDARYAINQLDQQLRLMGLRATIKIGIEKIE